MNGSNFKSIIARTVKIMKIDLKLSYCREKMEVHNQQQNKWEDNLYPSEAGEDTPECQAISSR